MKTTVLLLALTTSLALAQGPLLPPSLTPAPTMKSLDQIEARTPIGRTGAIALPGPHFTITQPGSYYLTGNISVSGGNAVVISSDNVTLDLNGFTIKSISNPASGSGIYCSGQRKDIAICNGHIKGDVIDNGSTTSDRFTGPGFLTGILLDSGRSPGIRIKDIGVSGCDAEGIMLWHNGIVENCTVHTVGDTGIDCSQASRCRVEQSYSGIDATIIVDSYGESYNGFAIRGKSVSNSYGNSKNESLNFPKTSIIGDNVNNCYGEAGTGVGIGGGNVFNSTGKANNEQGSGINAQTATACYGIRFSPSLGNGPIYTWIAVSCGKNGGTITAPGGKFLGTP